MLGSIESQASFRFYKPVIQSGDPTSPVGFDGTMVLNTTTSHLWVFHVTSGKNPAGYGTGSWSDLTSQSNMYPTLRPQFVATVNTNTTTVTWVDGDKFATGTGWNGQNVTINGVEYTISSVTSATVLVLTGSAGVQRGVAFSTAYSYIWNWSDAGSSAGALNDTGAARKAYALNIALNRSTAYPKTGDSNDAIIKATYNNYAVNDANFIIRGINMTVFGRSPGVFGIANCASFTNDIRSGCTIATSIALSAMSDDGGIVTGVNYAADFIVRRQGADAPTEEGAVRIRTLAACNQLPCAIRVNSEDTSIVGFARLIDVSANQYTLKQISGKVTLFKINIGGTAYYVRASTSAVTVEGTEA
jgi:hypothetical protein